MGVVTGGAFARARAMFAAILAAGPMPLADQRAALEGIEPYKSRGKGQGLLGNKHSRHRVAMDKRAAVKARNRSRS